MNELIGRVFSFEKTVFRDNSDLYFKLPPHGQSPKALMISRADSRMTSGRIMQARTGNPFTCRNAGNIAFPFTRNDGVSRTVEYPVMEAAA